MGPLLAHLVQRESPDMTIVSMCIHTDAKVYTQEAINKVFYDHLKGVYTEQMHPKSEALEELLVEIRLPGLSPILTESLDVQISKEEVVTVINNLKPGKTPGSHGLPATFYQKYEDVLTDKQLEVYGEALSGGSLPNTMQEALVVIIPKTGRDPESATAYRSYLRSQRQADLRVQLFPSVA
ncbi:hypothetical protein NDU88_006129 [Pleurodeles waltl]|uniref:Uncharacterized protein n=1 Tax=Pleurodeles waltl TaxID=8319 RepID=A0AAV7MBC1_PLEWA|nr:hypothetical protein NDU88_006129 [Pleurodeles waltl]